MKPPLHLLTGAFALGLLAATADAALPAFPEALGIGSAATGGARISGHAPTVYHVTNLNDAGAGSFRDAVSASYRIIVFDVGGNITLVPGSAVSVHDNVTIAGETAPGGGIAITGAEVSFSNCNNVICRHVRFRQSSLDPNTGKSAVGMDTADTIIMDHISVEFGQWDNIDCNSSTNITYQHILDANPIGQQFNAHADSAVTWFSNLWSSAHNRNPLAKGNIEYVNNVLYNFQAGFTAHTGGTFSMDIVNNCFIAGPSGSPGTPFFQMGGAVSVYGPGNYFDSNKDATLNGSGINVPAGITLTSSWNPTVTNSLPTLSAADAYAYVVSTAGAQPWNRDPVDALVITDVTSLGKKGRMWTSETQTGLANGGLGTISAGTAYVDTDGDGLPDFWEAAVGASTTSVIATGTAPSGYLFIEDYLHFLAAPHAITIKNTAVSVDLKQFTAGFSSPVFAVSGATGGTIALAADGHTAVFTPTTSFVGLGSFQFSLPYPSGATATFTVSVCVSTVAIPPPPPTNVTWVGNSGANSWDVNNTGNAVWGMGRTYFVTGDNATLDDTSQFRSVSLVGSTQNGSLAPGAVEVNTNLGYAFAGAGWFSGSGALSKDGSGTLTIGNTTANTFTGGIALNAGGLVVNQTVGTGAITLGPGTTLTVGASLSTNTLAVNGAVTLKGATNNIGPITGDGTLNFAANTRLDLRGDLSTFTGLMSLGSGSTSLRFYGALGSATADFDLGTGTGSIYPRNGSVTIALGSLSGGSGTVLGGASSDTNPTIYSIGANGADSTFAGQIGGADPAVSVIKTGAGTLTLTGTSNYTGTTTVSTGTLVVNGTLGNTAVTVASGATLLGSGTIGGAVSVAAGGLLSEDPTKVSTLTFGNGLTLSGQTLSFDLSSTAASGNDQLKLTGGVLSLTGTITIVPTMLNSTLGAGTYNLITGGTSTTGTPTINLVLPAGTRQTFTTSTAGGKLQLIVSGTADNLNWIGTQGGGTWDLNATNWAIAPLATTATDKFYNLDFVNFTDSGSSATVSLAALVQPAVLQVTNASKAYTFGGTGGIGGPGQLIKSGTGTLTFNVPATTSLSSTTNGTKIVTVATAGLFVGESVSGTGIAAGTTIAVVGGSTITLSVAATASGTNTLSYSTYNQYTGGTVINGGTIQLASYGTGGIVADLGTGPVTLSGGTLTMAGATGGAGPSNGSLYNDLYVPAGATGTFNVTQRSGNGSPFGAVFGALTGSGTLNLGVNYVRGGIAGDWSGFSGTLNVTTPTSSGDFFLATNYANAGLPQAAVNLSDNVRMYFSGILSQGDGTAVPVGELSGTASSVLMGGVTGGREFAWVIGGRDTDPSKNATFAGTIAEQNTGTVTSLFKVGNGIWTLSGSTNLNGRVNVQQGTLALTGTLTSADAIDIQSGATFTLSAGTVTADSLTIESGATLAGCGTINSSVSNNGTLSFNCGGLTTVNGDLQNNGTLTLTGGSTLVPNGNFTNNGTMTVVKGSLLSAAGAATFINNGTLDLLTGANALPANFVNNGTVIDSSSLRRVQIAKAGTTVMVTVIGYTQHSYQLQGSDSLTAPNWAPVGATQVPNTSGQTLTFSESTVTGTQRFYRITVLP